MLLNWNYDFWISWDQFEQEMLRLFRIETLEKNNRILKIDILFDQTGLNNIERRVITKKLINMVNNK